MPSTIRIQSHSSPRRGVPGAILLLALFVSLPVALGGPGGSGVPDLPVSTLSSGGGSHSALLPSGATLGIDFTVGSLHLGAGTGAGGYTLSGGFQAQREAIEEGSGPTGIQFRRGDANTDGLFNIADAIATLGFLFSGGTMNCFDAGDSNDDELLDIADAIFVLGSLFSGGDPPAAPGPDNCGVDPTGDTLGCDLYSACP